MVVMIETDVDTAAGVVSGVREEHACENDRVTVCVCVCVRVLAAALLREWVGFER